MNGNNKVLKRTFDFCALEINFGMFNVCFYCANERSFNNLLILFLEKSFASVNGY